MTSGPRPLSDRMLAENAHAFSAMVGHRFVQDILGDRLPRAVFDRYLVIEGAFVDTAISIFAFALARADRIETRRRLVAVLDALANDQVGYFERVLSDRGITPDPDDLAAPSVMAFRDGMHRIAETGGLPEIATTMFAAEWMYWTWSSQAAAVPVADPHLRDWIALHVTPGFEDQARWLRAEVDRAGTRLDPAGQDRLIRLFGDVLRLETAFHHAAYAETPPT